MNEQLARGKRFWYIYLSLDGAAGIKYNKTKSEQIRAMALPRGVPRSFFAQGRTAVHATSWRAARARAVNLLDWIQGRTASIGGYHG